MTAKQNISTPHESRPFVGHGHMGRHTGICVSGQMAVRSDDGTEVTIGAGDVVVIEPGHDAWTVGDEACVLLDTGVTAYSKP